MRGFFWIFNLLILLCGGCNGSTPGNNPDGKITKSSFQHVSGSVVRITDGDTFEMLAAGNKNLRIRIHGIDAPERGQPFYRKSRDFLGTLCFHKQVNIQVVNKDRWGRLVAHAFTPDGQSIGYKMVENGFAWHFTRYSRDPKLKNLANSARMRKAGLWVDKNPVAPWKWRRGNKG